ncbi:tripartite motif-containing protein 49C-like [Neophocaena asiaeorientalis asiaeorientalis]|uniref:Tripartite motif-containing protein 49C-like n=1 Tax=Neophocaena asiaeorientalis asiaeorientalis TaxID=1706337 RepID=A0A341BJZ9_NEOAA|nr:tripartite motif-containing protein 49C-like [Neophocaena asiaeorientalis asiaeorientalis]
MYLKGKLLSQIYEELKELCHKPDMELLQHYDNMLKRSESAQLHVPQPVVPQLSSWPIPGLVDWLNQFQGNR